MARFLNEGLTQETMGQMIRVRFTVRGFVIKVVVRVRRFGVAKRWLKLCIIFRVRTLQV